MEAYPRDPFQAHEDAKARFGWLQLFLTVVIYLAISIVIGVILSILSLAGMISEKTFNQLSWSGNNLLLDAVFVLFTILLYKPLRRYIKPIFMNVAPMKRPRTYLYIVLGWVAIYVMQYVTLDVIGFESNSQQQQDLGLQTASTAYRQIVLMISIVLLAPIKEEILFRGLFFRFLTKKTHLIVGLVLSSLLFGMLHGGLIVTASLLGMIFALVYWKTRSIYAAMLLHFLWNGSVTLLSYLYQ